MGSDALARGAIQGQGAQQGGPWQLCQEWGSPSGDTARGRLPEPVALPGQWALSVGAGMFALLQTKPDQLCEEGAGALWVQHGPPAVAPSISSLAGAARYNVSCRACSAAAPAPALTPESSLQGRSNLC